LAHASVVGRISAREGFSKDGIRVQKDYRKAREEWGENRFSKKAYVGMNFIRVREFPGLYIFFWQ